MRAQIRAQEQRVREAYAKTNSVNPDYETQFDRLHDLRMLRMAECFRKERGLPINAPTPYDEEVTCH